MSTVEELARALLRELNDAMKSPRGDYYQGDIADPHRTRHIIERHIATALAAREAETREACAKIAETTRGGYTANIRLDASEQEMIPDPDGPWVLNSDIAAAIRAGAP